MPLPESGAAVRTTPPSGRLRSEQAYTARRFRSVYSELAWRYRLRADQAQRSGFGDVLMTVDEARSLADLLDDAGSAIGVALELGGPA